MGRTERDLAYTFDRFLHELGADGPSFPTTVASGPNGATPHAHTSERVIERGETVVVDAGAVVGRLRVGLHADVRDRPAAGRARARVRRRARGAARGARRRRAGTTGKDADAAAREVIERNGSASASATGSATASACSSTRRRRSAPSPRTRSAENHVVTVEPGVYLPGSAGSGSRTSSSCGRRAGRAHLLHQRSSSRSTNLPRDGGRRLHEPVQERDAHRARRRRRGASSSSST